jgi:hypothetical protein
MAGKKRKKNVIIDVPAPIPHASFPGGLIDLDDVIRKKNK